MLAVDQLHEILHSCASQQAIELSRKLFPTNLLASDRNVENRFSFF